jgi:thiol:disulfide interchange protein DsbC
MIIKACIVIAVVIVAYSNESKAGEASAATQQQVTVQGPCDNVFKQIDEHAFLPETFSIISKKPIDNLCEVILETKKKYLTLYVSEKYVLVGDIFQDKRALTRRAIDEIEGRVVLENREQLEDCVAISYTPVDRNLHRSIYMVSDPDCHFCKLANDEIIYLSERYGFNIKVIFYPLGNENKSIEAACRKMTFDEYSSEEFALEEIKDTSHCETGTQLVEKSKSVLKTIGISAVPTFIFAETGQKVAGADMKKLETEIIINLAAFEKQLVANAN